MSKTTLKDWFYLEMVSHRVINDILDKNQKSYVKRIYLVTDDGIYDQKAFYTVEIVFYSSSMNTQPFIQMCQIIEVCCEYSSVRCI